MVDPKSDNRVSTGVRRSSADHLAATSLDLVEVTPGDEPGHFTGGFPVATAEFVRGDDGEVVALLVGNGRTRDVRFVRQ